MTNPNAVCTDPDRQMWRECTYDQCARHGKSDPRQPGQTYRCAYWGKCYTVLAIHEGGWIDVMWEDGLRPTSHCTAWDPRDKRIVL